METPSRLYNSKEQIELKKQINDLKECLTEYMMNYSSGEQQFQEFKKSIQTRYEEAISKELEPYKCPNKNSVSGGIRALTQTAIKGYNKNYIDPCNAGIYRLKLLKYKKNVSPIIKEMDSIYYPVGKLDI